MQVSKLITGLLLNKKGARQYSRKKCNCQPKSLAVNIKTGLNCD